MDDIKKFMGNKTLSVSEAMQQIDNNAYGILFIVDDDHKLIGSVTDGDIRRYLLAGGKISGEVVDAANKNPKVAKNDEEARMLYHKKNYVVIPVVNESGIVIAMYTDEGCELKKRNALNIPVVINAGGRGTRLDPYTRVLPKPLIPVGDLPIIEHIMQEYQTYSCNEFHIIVNYKKDLIKAYFSDNRTHYNITWYDEAEPLGTGGGLTLLRKQFKKTFFFVNCDALLTANYESMLHFHKENRNVITMICAFKNLNVPYGTVEIGVDGVIEEMKEKPLMSFLANTGIYIVEPEVIDDMEDGVSVDFPDIVEKERSKGRRVAVFPISENDWMDMGQLSELEKMRIKLYGE